MCYDVVHSAGLIKWRILTSEVLSCACRKSIRTSPSAGENMASVSCMTIGFHIMQAGRQAVTPRSAPNVLSDLKLMTMKNSTIIQYTLETRSQAARKHRPIRHNAKPSH